MERLRTPSESGRQVKAAPLHTMLWMTLTGALAGDASAVTFVDATGTAGVGYVQSTSPMLAQVMTGGAAVADVDGDGRTDLFVTRIDDHDLLFRNLGGGLFTDFTTTSGLDAFDLPTNGAVFGDVDNDGDPDLYVSTVAGTRYYLFINDGNGVFTEDATARGAAVDDLSMNFGWTVSVGDYDRDGWLDIVTSEWLPVPIPTDHARLLRNQGAGNPGHFTDVTVAAGVSLQGTTPNPGHVFSFAPAFVDLDDDGYPDLAVAGDFGSSQLFWNDGDGTFTNGTVAAGIGTGTNEMGSSFGDYDNDGDLDWYVTSIDHPEGPATKRGNRLFRNEGARVFSDQTDAAGVRDGYFGWGTVFFDYDNDGDLDIAETNGMPPDFLGDPMRLWRNDAGVYTEVSASLGVTDTGSGKGLLTFDYDEDGDLDLFVVNNGGQPVLYRNDGGNTNSWLRVEVSGEAPSHPEGLGARVIVTPTIGGPSQIRHIGVSSHFLGQSERVAHFGLGAGSDPVDEVRIVWPSSRVQVFSNVARNGTLSATEPSAFECNDSLDNDGDGLTDLADPGCDDASDPSERSIALRCDDGIDNDDDGTIDHPADVGCASPEDGSEGVASVACDDGADNDADGYTDYPADPGCASVGDLSESEVSLPCDDGADNDGDGLIDYANDPGCLSVTDGDEIDAGLACDDGADNDGDTFTDSADPGCFTASDPSELNSGLQCDDGVDNDLDGQTDFPDDPECAGPADASESLVSTVPAAPIWGSGALAVALAAAGFRARRRGSSSGGMHGNSSG